MNSITTHVNDDVYNKIEDISHKYNISKSKILNYAILKAIEENIFNNKKVFLGGTSPSEDPLYGWRGELIPMLKINYFNPIVENWTNHDLLIENREKNICSFLLYTITCEINGYYSIAEMVDSSNKSPEKTIFCLLKDGFSDYKLKSFDAIIDLLFKNGAKIFYKLNDVAEYVNNA